MQCLPYAENPKCLEVTAKSQITSTQARITKLPESPICKSQVHQQSQDANSMREGSLAICSLIDPKYQDCTRHPAVPQQTSVGKNERPNAQKVPFSTDSGDSRLPGLTHRPLQAHPPDRRQHVPVWAGPTDDGVLTPARLVLGTHLRPLGSS